jgi:hypothetical protein
VISWTCVLVGGWLRSPRLGGALHTARAAGGVDAEPDERLGRDSLTRLYYFTQGTWEGLSVQPYRHTH